MTLTTNQDGLLTLEGLVVANQEEVWQWINDFNNYVLPDDQFTYEVRDVRGLPNTNQVTILRKPVSDVGEKNEGLGESAEFQKLSFDEFMQLIGASPDNATAVTIWKTLEHNNFIVTRKP